MPVRTYCAAVTSPSTKPLHAAVRSKATAFLAPIAACTCVVWYGRWEWRGEREGLSGATATLPVHCHHLSRTFYLVSLASAALCSAAESVKGCLQATVTA